MGANFVDYVFGHHNAYSMQSKHIVIFDTLIKQSKSDEVEAVLGK